MATFQARGRKWSPGQSPQQPQAVCVGSRLFPWVGYCIQQVARCRTSLRLSWRGKGRSGGTICPVTYIIPLIWPLSSLKDGVHLFVNDMVLVKNGLVRGEGTSPFIDTCVPPDAHSV